VRANHAPFIVSGIGGPDAGTNDTAYTFDVTAGDSDGDWVGVRFAWGDGDTSDWGHFERPPYRRSEAHKWDSSGTYVLTAQARDMRGLRSEWSGAHTLELASAYPWQLDTFRTGFSDDIAVLPSGELMYATDYAGPTVWVARTSDGSIVTQIPIGYQSVWTIFRRLLAPSNCAYAYVLGYNEEYLAAIRTSDHTVVATMLDYEPDAVAVSPDGSLLYVAAHLQNGAQGIVVYRTADHTPFDTLAGIWSSGGYQWTVNMAVRPDGRFLYLTDFHHLFCVDLEEGRMTSYSDLLESGPMAVTPDGAWLYVLTGRGRVYVIRTSDNAVVDTVETGGGDVAECDIGILPDGRYVYAGSGEEGVLAVIRTSDNQIVRRRQLPSDFGALDIDRQGNNVYVQAGYTYALRR
jgi:DNA-binding beta-propeller fold protein YncE